MTALRIGSLFSGIGGLELGIEWATGAKTVWNCEMDTFCRKVLAKHWPDATQYEDVKNIDASVEPVDIITGGFPCQDLSIAGKQAGLSGERSGLWHEYARIIRELRPRFVFVENVPALRNFVSDGGLGRVLGDLAESGYDAEWDCVPAAAVGAPHVRDRIFILAWRRDVADAADGRGEAQPAVADGPALLQRGAGAGDGAGDGDRPEGVRVAGGGGEERERREVLAYGFDHPFPPPPNSSEWAGYLERHPEAQPGIRRDADGVPRGLDKNRRKRLRALGNAVVPQAAARAWELLIERSGVTV
jgi:DNA (cytosine-5)-methyltransferase 1